MTDQTPEQTDDQTPVLGAEIDANGQADLPEGDGTGDQNPNAEAAKYRVRAREAETALAEAQSRLAVLQRAEVERLASADLSHPTDIFTMSGNDVSSYLTETGTVDAAKVAADVAAILTERPGLKPQASAVDRSQGLHSPQKHEPTWESMFQS